VKILCVEDEPQLAGYIQRALQRAGHEADVAATGPSAVQLALKRQYEVVILDVNLPGCDGFEVLQRLRKADVGSRILMLTARSEVGDRVHGLRAGADDYLAKPFAMEELLARIDAVARRGGSLEPRDVLRVANVVYDVRNHRVSCAGQPVSLSPRELQVLRIMMDEPGRTFTRDEFCERIWHREHEYDTRTVEVFIMRLRRKLDEGRPEPLIETVRGTGYRIRNA
jgi:DNA-binding response OmpR family regulator